MGSYFVTIGLFCTTKKASIKEMSKIKKKLNIEPKP